MRLKLLVVWIEPDIRNKKRVTNGGDFVKMRPSHTRVALRC